MVLDLAGHHPQRATWPKGIKSKMCHSAVSQDSLDTTENNLEFRKIPD